MMTKTLCLFPDTNFFIQCKIPQELDWMKWKEFSEVHLIVCRPVQREIDDQKNRGENNRVGKRARKTYSTLFRPIAIGEKQHQLIRQAAPKVKLFLEAPSQPDPELSRRLDYSKPDDEVVGCLSRYTKEHPCADARLLSNDAGALMTAKSLALSVEPIATEWLLPPEHSRAEREIAHLKRQIQQLENQEPQFRIRCIDYNDNEVAEISLVHNKYEPLTAEEMSSCIESLKRRFPIATVFNRQTPKPPLSIVHALVGVKWNFLPASKVDIEKYRDIDYPEWLEECRTVLMSIHQSLQDREGQPSFTIEMENMGSRPADDALVVFRARGSFSICPPPYIDDDIRQSNQTTTVLPPPPTPPQGRWESTLSAFNQVLNPRLFEGLAGLNPPSMEGSPFTPKPYRRDSNSFYYKPDRQSEPSDSFSLECEQWRHGTGPVKFIGDFHLPEQSNESTGLLESEIHARNLSKPIVKKMRVKINIQRVSSKSYANHLVNLPSEELFSSDS